MTETVHEITDAPKKRRFLTKENAARAGLIALIAIPTAYVVLKTKSAIDDAESTTTPV